MILIIALIDFVAIRFLKLNTDRGTKRRKPIPFTSVLEPFNDDLFNFTKVNPGEYLFKFHSVSGDSSGKSSRRFYLNEYLLILFYSDSKTMIKITK